MRSTPDSDPVLLSVAAYSNDPDAYAARYAEHRRELPERFAALLLSHLAFLMWVAVQDETCDYSLRLVTHR